MYQDLHLGEYESEQKVFSKEKNDYQVEMGFYVAGMMIPVKTKTARTIYEQEYNIRPWEIKHS